MKFFLGRSKIKKIWQKKQQQYLFVMDVDMNRANGLENALLVENGILFLKRKLLQVVEALVKINQNQKVK